MTASHFKTASLSLGIASLLVCAVLIGCFGRESTSTTTANRPAVRSSDNGAAHSMLEVPGKTQPTPGRLAHIAPAVSRPVTEVLISVGDTVRKGQTLVKFDDRLALAELYRRQEALTDAQSRLARLKSEPTCPASEVAVQERSVAKASAAVDVARAALKKYTLTAAIDGVVASLHVQIGQVGEPGVAVWGEIVDLREIDVRCELTPDQADRVSVDDKAQIVPVSGGHERQKGPVVNVGIAADPRTGMVPVLIRLDNANGRWACREQVRVQFTAKPLALPGD